MRFRRSDNVVPGAHRDAGCEDNEVLQVVVQVLLYGNDVLVVPERGRVKRNSRIQGSCP